MGRAGIDYPGLCVVFYCHDGEGNFLFQLRSARARNERLRWDVGGGAVEHGESTAEAVRREVMEEYGTTPIRVEELGVRQEVFGAHHWVAFDHLVEVDRTLVHIGDPQMIDEITWAPLHLAPRPMHTALPAAMERYATRLELV